MTLSLKKMASKAGYLELILGPMFSGKTSKLLEFIFSIYDELIISYENI